MCKFCGEPSLPQKPSPFSGKLPASNKLALDGSLVNRKVTTSAAFSAKLCSGEVGGLLRGPFYGQMRFTMVTLKRFIILTPLDYFCEGNKKPAEAGFFKTILTSCQKPPRPWSIIRDPEHILRSVDAYRLGSGVKH